MSLHPEIKHYLDAKPAAGQPPSIKEMRDGMISQVPPVNKRPAVHAVEDRWIAGSEYDIPIRVYTPEGEGPFALFVYFHGGGFVTGNLDTHDVNCREIANASGCKVIAVDYRLAPEFKFPAAHEDCYNATKWVSEHAAELSGDPSRLAVGGPSAGGNLAAAVSLMARDRKGFPISKQVLIYPSVDINDHDGSYASRKENGKGYGLEISPESSAQTLYLTRDGNPGDPYISPIKAEDFSGLPDALIITAEYDPLRDEGESYAFRLIQAGVRVEARRFRGTIHGFMFFLKELSDYSEAYKMVGTFLKNN